MMKFWFGERNIDIWHVSFCIFKFCSCYMWCSGACLNDVF